ncbi:hypothetical protein AKO1_007537, partial [Acrasis kona]
MHQVTDSDVVWAEKLLKDWNTEKQTSAKADYINMHEKYPGMSHCYSRLKKSWDTLIKWTSTDAPLIYRTLKKEKLDYKSHLQQYPELPKELVCSYLIQNGQDYRRVDGRTGLFGGYDFYNQQTNFAFSEFHQAQYTGNDFCFRIGTLVNTLKMTSIVVMIKDLQHRKKGQVCVADSSTLHVIADSYLEFFETYVNNLVDRHIYDVKESMIIRYPNCAELGSDTTTRGVRIRCNALFIPEFWNKKQYFFAYRIRISMDESEQTNKSCKLLSRHWNIMEESKVIDSVDGPGVIGQYPVISPGSYFEYCSCSPLSRPHGSMSGYFTMQLLRGEEEFDAVVGEFPLSVN